MDGDVRLCRVRDEYEFDACRWVAGPRRAVRLVYLSARAEVRVALPAGVGEAVETAFDGRDRLMEEWVWAAMRGRHTFRTLQGAGDLERSLRISRIECAKTACGIAARFFIDMELY